MRRKGIKMDFEMKDVHNHSLQHVSPKLAVRGQKHYARPWKD